MATGGVSVEEELYSFELFECSVCLESLINKQPRLLSCGHTFCIPCLQQLLEGNTVNCPKCRSPTRLPPGGMQALPKNTDINKMREREQELSARNDNFCQMCKNRDSKVEFICTSCSKRLICQACFEKHRRIPALKAHNVLPIEETLPVKQTHENCKKHGELLEYFCPQCEEAICVTCACDPQHEEHCDQIVDLKTGLKELKASMHTVCEEFQQNAKKVEECAEILKQETDSINEYKESLSAKCEEVETILNQMKEQLKVITELYQPIRNSCQEINTHFEDVQNEMSEIKNLQQGSDTDIIGKIKECQRNCDCVMNDTQMILNRKITFPENMKQNIKIVGDVGQVKTIEVSLKEKLMAKTQQKQKFKNNELKNLELLSEIKPGGTVDMRNISEVVSVGDGTVILVNKYLQRINTDGNIVKIYQVPLDKYECYKSACVHGDCLFVLTSDDVITKMSLDGSDGSIKYRPEGVITIDYIYAIGDNVILISEGGLDGRLNGSILEYNTETNQVIERVSDIVYPKKVSVLQAGQHTKYIVKCYKNGERVKVYNRAWNLLSTIDIYRVILTVTPGGKLLLAQFDRIHEYSQDGRFIKELLDKYKFNQIQDITWSGGCLWVLEGNPSCMKIFVSN